jgi:hypothetical protein
VSFFPFVVVSRGGKLVPEMNEVISLIAKNDLTLATGHVSPEEALMIIREAKRQGVLASPVPCSRRAYRICEGLRRVSRLRSGVASELDLVAPPLGHDHQDDVRRARVRTVDRWYVRMALAGMNSRLRAPLRASES